MNKTAAAFESSKRSQAWAGVFALVYDPFLSLGEWTGVRTLRRDIVRRARGRTVEIGAGTGLNLMHYPDAVDELVLAEPDTAMRSRLEKRLHRAGRRGHVVDAPAERLPFPDQSVDTVVTTFVLCTVDAPSLALREIARVLHPDGQLLFLEHVRAATPRLARWQDRLETPWRRFARGCRCNRDTALLMSAHGFDVADISTASWRAMPPIVRPLIAGRAQRTGAIVETDSFVANRASDLREPSGA
jgi:ubiquinone/menaquinone biosynthesis C-methylase UbiE